MSNKNEPIIEGPNSKSVVLRTAGTAKSMIGMTMLSKGRSVLQVMLTDTQSVDEFKNILFRGMNCLEDPPQWAHDVYNMLDHKDEVKVMTGTNLEPLNKGPFPALIHGMTPEQIAALRPMFEKKMLEMWVSPNFTLENDGFSYADSVIDNAWEGFIIGWSTCLGEGLRVGQRGAEDLLREMRQYSKCFTGAFDKKEPVFVLRAQDDTAYKALAQWIQSNAENFRDNDPKFIAAKATLGLFLKWPTKKKPD